jgi:hypothetical protein
MKAINNLLIFSSLLVLAIYAILVIFESINEEEISMINLSMVFGNVIVTTIFILDKAASSDFKVAKSMLYLLRFLIVFSAVFAGVLLNELIQVGFSSGKELFWQSATIFLALGSFTLIQVAQRKSISE